MTDNQRPSERRTPPPGSTTPHLPPEIAAEPNQSSRIPPFVRSHHGWSRTEAQLLLRVGGALLVVIATAAAAIAIVSLDLAPRSPSVPETGPVVISSTDDDPTSEARPAYAADPILENPRNREMTICIDPGHGGDDRGFQRVATGNAPAMDESWITLTIARELERILTGRGFSVSMTRVDDTRANEAGIDTTLDGIPNSPGFAGDQMPVPDADEVQARIDTCNDAKSDLMLSLHVDASDDPNLNGYTMWVDDKREFSALNKLLASLIQEELSIHFAANNLDTTANGVRTAGQAEDPTELHIQAHLPLLGPNREGLKEPSTMPGVIIELLTITSDSDIQLLTSEQGRAVIIMALDRAIDRYFDQTTAR